MRYMWKAHSEDGCYEAKSSGTFTTRKDAYIDMRFNALKKMQWNTEWEDLDDDGDTLGYEVHFSKDKIIHESYSGRYIYEIVIVPETINAHGRTWQVIDSYSPKEMKDWEIMSIDGFGDVWMNNYEGFIVIIEPNGRILKSDI